MDVGNALMKVRNLFLVLMLFGARQAVGQPVSSPVSEMTVVGIFASKSKDTTVYCLLGGGACLVPKDHGNADRFIAQWLKSHSAALVTPVSAATQTMPISSKRGSPAKLHEMYIWIADGDDVLNVALVREGYYTGNSMIDMVESEYQQNERAKTIAEQGPNTGFADMMAKLKDSIPKEDRPRRFIPDGDYESRMKEISSAEQAAQVARKGIWSGNAHRNEADISQKSRESFPARDLYVHGVNAHRLSDGDVYCLIGGDFCLTTLGPIVHEDQVAFISDWLTQHPGAIATPISNESFKVMRDQPPIHGTYIWIEDGKESLNLALVRNGFYGAHALTDMVEARQQLEDSMKAPSLANARSMMTKERAEEAAPRRLITDQDYKSKMLQANAAEQVAAQAQLGIWSPSEIVHWKAASDAEMIDVYSKHPEWFQQAATLAHEDERLLKVVRTTESITQARRDGVPQAELDAYVGLLEKLGVNETIANVVGLGRLSLVKADIIVGLFDNGTIKGYVYAPRNPHPIVNDLEVWPPDLSNVDTAYRSIGNNWYLFVLRH